MFFNDEAGRESLKGTHFTLSLIHVAGRNHDAKSSARAAIPVDCSRPSVSVFAGYRMSLSRKRRTLDKRELPAHPAKTDIAIKFGGQNE